MCIIRNGIGPKEGICTTNRLISLDRKRKRNNRVMDFLHKASSKVVEFALRKNHRFHHHWKNYWLEIGSKNQKV
ncbi:hypothetical protein M3226_00795 [Neobacillus cucumis]|uniref:hypothetical protein n=1 Tax=Neobacillus cucumis TaxID=1740721 RepID=UPI00203DC165|nr:hypothetical protein [Neobacillus cucumis]MCM3724240.1 hypothetical protein [Neobacillus cucumis]